MHTAPTNCKTRGLLTLAVTTALLSACGGSDDNGAPATTPVASVPVGDVIALTTSGEPISLNRGIPADSSARSR